MKKREAAGKTAVNKLAIYTMERLYIHIPNTVVPAYTQRSFFDFLFYNLKVLDFDQHQSCQGYSYNLEDNLGKCPAVLGQFLMMKVHVLTLGLLIHQHIAIVQL